MPGHAQNPILKSVFFRDVALKRMPMLKPRACKQHQLHSVSLKGGGREYMEFGEKTWRLHGTNYRAGQEWHGFDQKTLCAFSHSKEKVK